MRIAFLARSLLPSRLDPNSTNRLLQPAKPPLRRFPRRHPYSPQETHPSFAAHAATTPAARHPPPPLPRPPGNNAANPAALPPASSACPTPATTAAAHPREYPRSGSFGPRPAISSPPPARTSAPPAHSTRKSSPYAPRD